MRGNTCAGLRWPGGIETRLDAIAIRGFQHHINDATVLRALGRARLSMQLASPDRVCASAFAIAIAFPDSGRETASIFRQSRWKRAPETSLDDSLPGAGHQRRHERGLAAAMARFLEVNGEPRPPRACAYPTIGFR